MRTLTMKDISNQFYEGFKMHGYKPTYQDEEELSFTCDINGFDFSFDVLDAEYFWYGAKLDLTRELTDTEKRSLVRLYKQIPAEDVAFENFHIDDAEICLSSAFSTDLYDVDLLDATINTLMHGNELTAQLKSLQQL